MMHALYFLVIAAAMLVIARVLPGFRVAGWAPAIIASIVLGGVNLVVKPFLFVITLPLTILTLGLFLLVLNAICLWLTAALVPGFKVDGFFTTLLASIALAAVSMVWRMVTTKE